MSKTDKNHPYYIDFLNKDKGHQPDRKTFEEYEDAETWGKFNLANYHPDLISSF